MQDTERVERALRESLNTSMSTASLAGKVCTVASMRALGAKVVVVDGMAVVRVRMGVRRGMKRTVTAGMDVFSQLMIPAFDNLSPQAVRRAVEALREALPEDAARVQEEVDREARRLTGDPETVRLMKAKTAESRAKQYRTERENLVSKMASLLSSGWTVDQLLFSVHEAIARSIMSS